MSQIVDTESAKEFMKEVLTNISKEELTAISLDLEIKSKTFRRILNQETIDKLSKDDIYNLLRFVSTTRRKANNILEQFNPLDLRKWIADLLYGNATLEVRFQEFYDHLAGMENSTRFDLAGELLHFTFPDKYWLWCRWMWNPKIKTGSLPLVITENFDLHAPGIGATYLAVGKATAFVHHTGEAAEFQTINRSLFGTDVFLCSVYIIYTYTVLRMRMTQEFNKVMPGLAEFTRRLLGVYKMEEYNLT